MQYVFCIRMQWWCLATDSFIQHKCYCTSGWAVDGWAVGELVTVWISEFKEKRVVVCILPENQLLEEFPRMFCPGAYLYQWPGRREVYISTNLQITPDFWRQPIDLRVGLPIFLEGYWEDVSWWESNRQTEQERLRKTLDNEESQAVDKIAQSSSVSILQGFHWIRSDHRTKP